MFEIEELDGSRILRYTLKENETVDRITLGMISNAYLCGFAGVTYIEENGQGAFSFFPGEGQPISEYLKTPVSIGILSQIVTNLADIYIRACAHLIPSEAMCFNPDYVYIDREGCVCLICVPVYPGVFVNSSENCIRSILALAVPESASASKYIDCLLGYVDSCGSFSWKQLKSLALTYQPEAEEETEACPRPEIISDTPDNTKNEKASDTPAEENTDEPADICKESTKQSSDVPKLSAEISFMTLIRNFSMTNLALYRKSRKNKRCMPEISNPKTDCIFDRIENGCAYLTRQKTGGIVPVTSCEFSIGKDPTRTDYTISGNPAISRYHATIIRLDGQYYLRDNGSTNRSYVDGRMLQAGETAEITDGTVIRLANEDFVFSEGNTLAEQTRAGSAAEHR